jgi:hypothetical protein
MGQSACFRSPWLVRLHTTCRPIWRRALRGQGYARGSPSCGPFTALRNSFSAPLWQHAAFIITGFSFTVADVLWLRVLAMIANIFTIIYSYYNPVGVVLWVPLQWSVVYVGVNLIYIGKILRDRVVFLTPVEQQAYDQHFDGSMPQPEFALLVRCASLRRATSLQPVLNVGQPTAYLFLVVSGVAEVEVGPGIIMEVPYTARARARADLPPAVQPSAHPPSIAHALRSKHAPSTRPVAPCRAVPPPRCATASLCCRRAMPPMRCASHRLCRLAATAHGTPRRSAWLVLAGRPRRHSMRSSSPPLVPPPSMHALPPRRWGRLSSVTD